MELTDAGTLGIFAIFALQVIDKVMMYVGKGPGQNGAQKNCPMLGDLERQVGEIHAIHTATDDDGIPMLPRMSAQSRQHLRVLEEIRDGLKNVRTCPLEDETPARRQ